MGKNLDKVVLNLLNQHIRMVCDIENKINDIVSYSKVSYNAELKKTRINEINVERGKYKKLLDELMNDYKYEYISESDYYDFKEKYMYELNKLNLEEEKLKNSKLNSYNLDWIENFKSIKKIDVIDRNIVDCFIKNIFIREDGNIEIYFRYNDQYKFALEYLNNKKI